MIDTATNTVLTGTGFPIPVGITPVEVAVTKDGKHAYVTNFGDGNVSVIDTATNTALTGKGFPIPVGSGPIGVAVTPDGKHAYVTNAASGTVSVIATATNTVLTGTGSPVGSKPEGVGIIPDTPFGAFSAKLEIEFDRTPNKNAFELQSGFTLGSASNGINPAAEPVTLQVGTFATTIPAGSFTGTGFGPFTFRGVIDGVSLEVRIKPTGTKRYALEAEARRANLNGTKNPVTVRLTIGEDSGTTSVNARIDRDHEGGHSD